MTRTILDISILQGMPPNNANRDDTGSPKTAIYGGSSRARVSSQAWKRATRELFNATLDPTEVGVRTKRVVELLGERIRVKSDELSVERAEELAAQVFQHAGIKTTAPRQPKDQPPKPLEAGYLIFLSSRQLDQLADAAIVAAASDDVEKALKSAELKKRLDTQHSVDIALFGRMVAEATDLNVDAAAQVAHAISVHKVDNEFDYFTAVDDHKAGDEDEDAGAGMIGTVEFNSSTLYRYATVDVDRLNDNLGSVDATKRAVEVFVDAFARSMPTGKQNTFANRTLPDAIIVSVRDTQPVNLVGAFESAVEAADRLTVAAERLADHSREIDENYGTTPVCSWVVTRGATAPLDELGTKTTLDQLIPALGAAIGERLSASA